MSENEKTPGLVEQLKDAIRGSGKSLRRLSKDAGIGTPQLSRFMRGERSLSLPAAEKVCHVLRLGLATLHGDHPPLAALPSAG
jgi:hypothetical protein